MEWQCITIVSGMDGLIEAAAFPETQIVVTAIVGMIGIRPTIAAIKAGKDIALANKETLVTALHFHIFHDYHGKGAHSKLIHQNILTLYSFKGIRQVT